MFGRRRRRGFGGGGGGLGMLLLAMQLLQLFQFLSRSNDYYPISLGVLALNIIAFLQPGRGWPSVHDACISVQGFWFQKQWKRLFLASFYHSSDFHLYYNMASFIWKAISLEKHFGSAYFLYMVAVFSVTTNLLYVGINFALAEVLDQWSYVRSCAVGFSGVIFALKIVTTHLQPRGMTMVMGFFPVPLKLACWVELVLISVLFPHVSFIGHLAGILVGLAFIYGPLNAIMNIPLSLLTGTLKRVESGSVDGLNVLSERHRYIVIILVIVFMLLFPLLVDLVPAGAVPGTQQQHHHHDDGRSYTYRAGTTGHRPPPPPTQPRAPQGAPRPHPHNYTSYTYSSGASGHGDHTHTSEEAELQEAIQRSLHTKREERGEISRPPPPYNPNFNPTDSGGGAENEDDSHSHTVGWNPDILDPLEGDTADNAPPPPAAAPAPVGFEGLHDDISLSDPQTVPQSAAFATPTSTSSLRHRHIPAERNRDQMTQNGDRVTPSPAQTFGSDVTGERRESNLSVEEVRAARLQKFGGSERQRRTS